MIGLYIFSLFCVQDLLFFILNFAKNAQKKRSKVFWAIEKRTFIFVHFLDLGTLL